MKSSTDGTQGDGGLGPPINRKKPDELPSVSDESKYVWKPLKPGFEINQHGHVRTKEHMPGKWV